jgi:ABC-2 type transport system ATP-binding protein
MSSSADPAVQVVGLTRDFGATRALDGASFEVGRGEFFGLLGPNGAGEPVT